MIVVRKMQAAVDSYVHSTQVSSTPPSRTPGIDHTTGSAEQANIQAAHTRASMRLRGGGRMKHTASAHPDVARWCGTIAPYNCGEMPTKPEARSYQCSFLALTSAVKKMQLCVSDLSYYNDDPDDVMSPTALPAKSHYADDTCSNDSIMARLHQYQVDCEQLIGWVPAGPRPKRRRRS